MGWFSSKKTPSQFPWISLESLEQLDEALSLTATKPVVLFKHSTRCSISGMALNNFENNWKLDVETCPCYLVDLLTYRDISNAIAEKTGVIHQSPQAFMLYKGEIHYEATHSGIDARKIQRCVSELND